MHPTEQQKLVARFVPGPGTRRFTSGEAVLQPVRVPRPDPADSTKTPGFDVRYSGVVRVATPDRGQRFVLVKLVPINRECWSVVLCNVPGEVVPSDTELFAIAPDTKHVCFTFPATDGPPAFLSGPWGMFHLWGLFPHGEPMFEILTRG
jgi:hypothetical protein